MLLTLFFFCSVFSSFKIQEQNEEVITWSSARLLTYLDFKADTSSQKHSAISCLKIIPTLFIEGNVMKYKITAGFYPGCSYMKYRDRQLLQHEQHHFDMVEVYARKMRQYLHSCNNTSVTKEDLNIALTKLDADLQVVQALYDRVTEHGLKLRAQGHWEKQIKAALDSLNTFSHPDGIVILGEKTSQ